MSDSINSVKFRSYFSRRIFWTWFQPGGCLATLLWLLVVLCLLGLAENIKQSQNNGKSYWGHGHIIEISLKRHRTIMRNS